MGTTLMEDPSRKPKAGKTTLVEKPRAGARLAGPAGSPQGSAPAATEVATDTGNANPESLVVGWLVVTAGPGKGTSREIGYGMNIVGRGQSNRISLDLGDDQISADDHFRIAYDGAHRKFHLVPGRGTNLVYVADAPLLSPVELSSHMEIKVGASTLRFVPLCGEGWDWS